MYLHGIFQKLTLLPKQIRAWFNWNAKPQQKNPVETKWLSKLVKTGSGRGRALQEVEIYQKVYGEKVNEAVSKDLTTGNATTNVERMAVRRRVASVLFEDESEEVKKEIREKWETEKQEAQIQARASVPVGENLTPEEYDK